MIIDIDIFFFKFNSNNLQQAASCWVVFLYFFNAAHFPQFVLCTENNFFLHCLIFMPTFSLFLQMFLLLFLHLLIRAEFNLLKKLDIHCSTEHKPAQLEDLVCESYFNELKVTRRMRTIKESDFNCREICYPGNSLYQTLLITPGLEEEKKEDVESRAFFFNSYLILKKVMNINNPIWNGYNLSFCTLILKKKDFNNLSIALYLNWLA